MKFFNNHNSPGIQSELKYRELGGLTGIDTRNGTLEKMPLHITSRPIASRTSCTSISKN